MRLEFDYVPDDLRDMERLYRRRVSGNWINRVPGGPLLLVVIIGAVVLPAMIYNDYRGNGAPATPAPPATPVPMTDLLIQLTPWLLIFGFIWFFVFRKLRRRHERTLAADPTLNLRHTVDVTDAGIVQQSGLARTEWNWIAFNRFYESDRLFLLPLAARRFLMLPKRALATPADIDALRHLLEEHIQPPTGGFPVAPPS